MNIRHRYPVILNCNYDSAGTEEAEIILAALDSDDAGVRAALRDLEEVLTEHACSESLPSREACEDAEAAVLAAVEASHGVSS